MDDIDELSGSSRWRPFVACAGLALVLAGSLWLLRDGSDAEPATDDVEVCQTTEYEGCPQRWEYLWADDQ